MPTNKPAKLKLLTAKQICKKIKDNNSISPKELANVIKRYMTLNLSENSEGWVRAVGNGHKKQISYRMYAESSSDSYDSGYVHLYAPKTVLINVADKTVVYKEDGNDYKALRELLSSTEKILNKSGFECEVGEREVNIDYTPEQRGIVAHIVKKKFLFWSWDKKIRRFEKISDPVYVTGMIPKFTVRVCCGKK